MGGDKRKSVLPTVAIMSLAGKKVAMAFVQYKCPGCGEDRGPYDSQRCGAMVVKHMKTCILKNPDKKEACMREARQCGQEENLKKALEGKEALPRASEEGSALGKRPRSRLSKSPKPAAGRASNPKAIKRPRKPVIRVDIATSAETHYRSLREAHMAVGVDRKTMADAIENSSPLDGARWYWEDGSAPKEPLCTKCGEKNDDRVRVYIVCDGCDREWHKECIEPPISKLPDGDWFCQECSTGE